MKSLDRHACLNISQAIIKGIFPRTDGSADCNYDLSLLIYSCIVIRNRQVYMLIIGEVIN